MNGAIGASGGPGLHSDASASIYILATPPLNIATKSAAQVHIQEVPGNPHAIPGVVHGCQQLTVTKWSYVVHGHMVVPCFLLTSQPPTYAQATASRGTTVPNTVSMYPAREPEGNAPAAGLVCTAFSKVSAKVVPLRATAARQNSKHVCSAWDWGFRSGLVTRFKPQ